MRLDTEIIENPLGGLRLAAADSPLRTYLLRRMRSRVPGLRIDTLYFYLTLLFGFSACGFPLVWKTQLVMGGVVSGAAFVAFVLQTSHAWMLPKRIWREFASSPALEELSATPLTPQQVLGPFVIVAFGSVLRSLLGFLLVTTTAMYCWLADAASVQLGMGLAAIAAVGVTGCLGFAVVPILAFAEALFWYLSLSGRSRWSASVFAAVVATATSAADLALSYWLFDVFGGARSIVVSVFGSLLLWGALQFIVVWFFSAQAGRLLAHVLRSYQELLDRSVLASRL